MISYIIIPKRWIQLTHLCGLGTCFVSELLGSIRCTIMTNNLNKFIPTLKTIATVMHSLDRPSSYFLIMEYSAQMG